MKHLLLIIAFFITTAAAADVERLPEYSRIYDPNRDPFVDGREAIANAQATQRRILIELGGNWCAWCNKLERFIAGNKTVKAKLYENFVVLKVNVSDENENREFLSAFPRVIGYPHFYVSRSDGSVLYSKDTAELLENGEYSAQRFLAFIERWRQKTKTAKTTNKLH
ncbi:thioredoxin family protein [Sulfuriflexus mobilis]|uniref:thioredoxin family protein n=1 Tax=Sulfuriflexus mobilis TaxID=1811807 RepID=UPI001559F8F5|nr:thioredoxin family protein [Sulfuriflexus mobilis]